MSMTPQPFLPYGRQGIDEADIAAVVEVLRGDFLTTGPAVEAFEAALAAKLGVDHAVVCSSGTTALHLALAALDVVPGDSIIVPSITFLATANAARYLGADVVFCDVDADSGLMRDEDLQAALGRVPAGNRAKAVLPVQLRGQCADMAAISKIARDHDLAIVEDACHAIGTTTTGTDGTTVATGACGQSDMAAFSFHPVKTMTMGEGGAVTTKDAAAANRMKRLRCHAMTHAADSFINADLAFDAQGQPNPWYYEMQEPGFNYRATDLQCALGLSQLARLEAFVARRRELVALYDALLVDLAPLVRPTPKTPGENPGWHLYGVLIDFEEAGISRGDLMRALRDAGIGTQVHYIPVHLQPYYRGLVQTPDLPGAMAYYRRCLSLPLFPTMTDGDVERVVETLTTILKTETS